MKAAFEIFGAVQAALTGIGLLIGLDAVKHAGLSSEFHAALMLPMMGGAMMCAVITIWLLRR